MKHGAKRLLIRPSPKSDESLPGYLLRLTEANAYDSPAVILALSGVKNRKNLLSHASYIATGQAEITAVAHIINKTSTTISDLVYKTDYSGPMKSIYIGAAVVHRSYIAADTPSVCPQCLAEDPYHRRLWDIAPYTACHKHTIQLCDVCHACSAQLSWARSAVARCRCGADLRLVRSPTVAEDELVVSRMVAECVDTGSVASHPLIRDLASLRAILHMGYMLTKKRPWAETELRPGDTPILARHQEIVEAFSPFVHWPTNFRAFLRAGPKKIVERFQ